MSTHEQTGSVQFNRISSHAAINALLPESQFWLLHPRFLKLIHQSYYQLKGFWTSVAEMVRVLVARRSLGRPTCLAEAV
jgi:hypothetical protein